MANQTNKTEYVKANPMVFETYELQVAELEKIRSLLELNQIRFAPIKGSVIRKLYPNPWMRICSDIDILVDYSSIKKVAKLFKDELGYQRYVSPEANYSFIAKNGVVVELMYELAAPISMPVKRAYPMLSKVWDFANPICEESYEYVLDEAMQYLFAITCMAVHFEEGDFAQKYLTDLRYLPRRTVLIQETSFARFERIMSDLGIYPNIEQKLEAITDGSPKARAAANLVRGKREKDIYILRRLFPNRVFMEHVYPSIKNKKYVLFFAWILRLVAIIKNGTIKEMTPEFKACMSLKKDYMDQMQGLLEELGLE